MTTSRLALEVLSAETEVMTNDDVFGDSVYESGDPAEETDEVDPVDGLTGDDPDEVDETGYSPPEREPYNLRRMPTAAEARRGESLDEHLAEEEPEVTGEDEPDLTDQDTVDTTIADEPDDRLNDQDVADPQPRAGRLVAPDEGSHGDHESDEIATDVGPAGYASSAEEAAMHIVDGAEDGEDHEDG
jgi:hypothetical protein